MGKVSRAFREPVRWRAMFCLALKPIRWWAEWIFSCKAIPAIKVKLIYCDSMSRLNPMINIAWGSSSALLMMLFNWLSSAALAKSIELTQADFLIIFADDFETTSNFSIVNFSSWRCDHKSKPLLINLSLHATHAVSRSINSNCR